MSFWLVSNGHVDRQLFLIVINVWIAKLLIICKITNFFYTFSLQDPKNYCFQVRLIPKVLRLLHRFFLNHNL